MLNKFKNMTVLAVPMGSDLVSAELSALQTHAVNNGATPKESGGLVSYPIKKDYCVKDAVLLTLAVGGTVTDFRPVFVVADLTANVPAAITSGKYLDADEVEQTHTWLTWCKENYPPLPDVEDGNFYVMSDSNGALTPLDELLDSSLTLTTKAQYLQLHAAWAAANPVTL